MQPQTKLSILQSYALQGNWQKAIALAARFKKLGTIRNAVLDAHMAYTNPRFLKQLGRDIEICKEKGKKALITSYKINVIE